MKAAKRLKRDRQAATLLPAVAPCRAQVDLGYKAVLLDIEGTTTPLSYGRKTLIPYVRVRLERWLADHWTEPAVSAVVAALRAQADADLESGLVDTPAVAVSGTSSSAVQSTVVANVLWQMDGGRKSTALKRLQGLIWAGGYASGELRGELFPDVHVALRGWKARGVRVAVYSSGSVEAQRLLFRHSVAGDLTPLLAGHYDTNVGCKSEPGSYTAIVAAAGFTAADTLFITDVHAEADAAVAAGLSAAISVRKGNEPLPRTTKHKLVTSLRHLFPPMSL